MDHSLVRCVTAAIVVLLLGVGASAQKLSGHERSRAKDMLTNVKNEIKDKYFDPKFKGVDLEAVFKSANEKLNAATTLGQAFGIIAQAVLSLEDSHTTFYPPSRSVKVDYGWRMQMIGDKCFVTAVKPKSEAEKVGLKAGDEVLAVEGFKPNRKEMWKIMYYYNAISPRNGLNVVVQSPDSDTRRELNIPSKLIQLRSTLRIDEFIREIELDSDRSTENRFVTVGNTVAWNLPTFAIDPDSVERIMSDRVRKSRNLIIDLRGNGGGYVVTLEALAGYFVDKDTKIADLIGRKKMDPQMAKTKGSDGFKGRLVVLIDSRSGSASEIFARFIQMHEKGVILGDQSAGAVMMSKVSSMSMGSESVVLYGMNVTHADVIMTDGVSLEHVGVTPNVRLLPSAESLSKSHDPVLAEAFKLLGENVTPERAGTFFPFDWAKAE